jgi:hypothetical protein
MRRFAPLWFGMVGLVVLLAQAAQADAQPGPLEDLIRSRLSTLRARGSVHAIHVPTGREVSINADQPMNTASSRYRSWRWRTSTRRPG